MAEAEAGRSASRPTRTAPSPTRRPSVSGPAGGDTIEFVNDSSTPHDVTIEDSGGSQLAQTEVITGDTTSTDATLDAGSYTFFCSVDGHREAGMEGTLTIK